MRAALGLLLLGACKISDATFMGPGVGGDARTDTNTGDGTNADAQQCFGSGAYTVCFTILPNQPTTISDNAIIDTATSSSCHPDQPASWMAAGQPNSCFIYGTNISVANVRVIGTRPLVLVATNQVTISGLVDASSRNNPYNTGPGAPYSTCPAFQGQVSFSAGGAGGSFMTRGANGGTGAQGAGQPGGISGLAEATPPTKLRAGCNGQQGGDGSQNPSPGGAGYAGGAIYIVAGSTISLASTAIINASGAGGGGAQAGGGGGGGGSGGMIVLYAPTITATGAKLVANGGAGGTGASGSSLRQPAGGDPDPASPATNATGVAGSTGTSIGGNGYATTAPPTLGVNSGAMGFGGGGGGAGAGYIQSNVPITGATTSPAGTVL